MFCESLPREDFNYSRDVNIFMVNFSPYLEYYFSLDVTLLYYYFWLPQGSTHTTAGFISQSALPNLIINIEGLHPKVKNIKWSTPLW